MLALHLVDYAVELPLFATLFSRSISAQVEQNAVVKVMLFVCFVLMIVCGMDMCFIHPERAHQIPFRNHNSAPCLWAACRMLNLHKIFEPSCYSMPIICFPFVHVMSNKLCLLKFFRNSPPKSLNRRILAKNYDRSAQRSPLNY